LLQFFEINHAASHLESAGGSVVLVLNPNVRSDARREQGPLNLRRWRNHAMYEMGGVLEFSKGR
jgi:hypothetical protein